jgi:uncharacterized protein Yka (UPF0111/DUF47 family)
VREKEAEADRVKGELYTRLYELNDPILLFLVSGIANAVSSISDSAENASDVLAIMLISGLA